MGGDQVTPPSWFEDQMLQLMDRLVRIQAEEHAQARRLRTLIWVLFWVNLSAVVIGGAVVAVLIAMARS